MRVLVFFFLSLLVISQSTVILFALPDSLNKENIPSPTPTPSATTAIRPFLPLANSPPPPSLATTTHTTPTPIPSGPATQLIVNPGENQEVNEASIVTLDGSASDFPPQSKVNWKLIFPKISFLQCQTK